LPIASSSATPVLPLPSQETDWLPALSSFNTPLNRLDDESEADEMEQSTMKFIKEE
jgi:hypothetical protein